MRCRRFRSCCQLRRLFPGVTDTVQARECARHRRSEAAAGEATAVDAARFWQESTIEPAFAATADMIAAFSHGQL
jgi:hypothetical protein